MPASHRLGWITVVAALLAGPAAAQSIEDKLDLCMSCHGDAKTPPGRGVPSISGQPAARIAEQLQLFRAGTRENPSMVMARRLTDGEIAEIAAAFAALPARP